jgi:hypothetical protein
LKKIIAGLLMLISISAYSDGKKPADSGQLFNALNIMAVPIGEKGMILKDAKGCLWVVKNSKDTPLLVAILAENSDSPLCEEKPVAP